MYDVAILVCLVYSILMMECRRFIAFIRLGVLVRLRARATRASLRWSMRRSIGSMGDNSNFSLSALLLEVLEALLLCFAMREDMH